MAHRFSDRRYAQALFELGAKGNKLDKWQADLEKVADLSRDPEVVSFLEHPKVNLQDKTRLLSRNLKDVSPEILNLVYLLIKRGAVAELANVAGIYNQFMDARQGIERGRLTAAVGLDEADVQEVSRQIGEILNKRVVLEGKVDESLLGGVVVRVAGKLMDGSSHTALQTLKQELS